MRIESPEQLARHILAGGSITIKTPSREVLADNELLMSFNVHDICKLVKEQEIHAVHQIPNRRP